MIISIIVAMDERRGIGRDNKIPWKISLDLKRFKKITMGHYIIMGRRTWESINRLLPGRQHIILSRDPDYRVSGCYIANSIEKAIEYARNRGETEVFIIGGADVFDQSLHIVDRLYLTTVHAHPDAEKYFPFILLDDWNEVGVPYGNNTSFHLSEYRAPGGKMVVQGAPIIENGQRVWKTFTTLEVIQTALTNWAPISRRHIL